MSDIVQSDRSKVRIFLVHGTFAPMAKWTRGGELIERLGARIDDLTKVKSQDIEFVPCDWAGTFKQAWFTQRSRDKGCKRVEATLRNYKFSEQDTSDQLNYIIAHSHGGNIILDAISNLGLDGKIRGVICMNTPFLVMFRRNFSTIAIRVLQISIALAVVLIASVHVKSECAVTNVSTLTQCLVDDTYDSQNARVVILIGASVLVLFAIFSKWLRKNDVVECMRLRQKNLVEKYSGSAIVKTPVLSAWNAGDEVLAVLRTLQSFSDIPFILLHQISMIILFFANLRIVAPNFYDWVAKGDTPEQWLLYVIAVVITPIIYCLFAAVGLLFNFAFLVFPIAGFDVRAWTNSLITRLAVGYLPVKVNDSTFVEFNLKSSWLNHSRIYEDEESLEYFAKWISNDINNAHPVKR